jgi:hypothetical protein
MLKKLVLALVVALLASAASAQTVTCSVSGLSAKQTALLTDFLASVNAQRAAQTPPLAPFANFSAYCQNLVVGAVLDYVRQQEQVNAAKVGAAATANGDQTAPNAQCTAAGLANGCTKNQVACFVLTGNVTCN